MNFDITFPIIIANRFEAYVSVRPQPGDMAINSEELINHFHKHGLYLFLDEAVVRRLVDEYNQHRAHMERVLVAKGVPPVDGENSRLEWSQNFWETGLKADASGRVNFYEQSRMRTITKNALIARLLPPTPAKPGTDIYGKAVTGTDGKKIRVFAGDNVAFDETKQEYTATVDGQLRFEHNRISVDTVHVVRGDVDFNESNVRFSGNAIITGSVKDLFVVDVGGTLEIHGTIEAATVSTGGDLRCKGGIFARQKGLVTVGGNFNTKLIDHANVRCHGGIDADLHILDSRVACAGDIRVPDGAIIGGETVCAGGVIVRELGAPSGTRTEIRLGVNLFEEERLGVLLRKHAETEQQQKQLQASLNNLKPVLKFLSPERREKLTEITFRSQTMTQELAAMREEIDALRAASHDDSHVIVSHHVHPGVTIVGKGQSWDNTEPLQGPVRIQWDRKRNALAVIRIDA